MAQWHHIQRDFSGGEISGKMLMRADTEVYKRSALEVRNFIPTLQGGLQRAPGTRFILDTDSNASRIIPFLSSANERCLILLTPLALKLYRNITSLTADELAQDNGTGTIIYRKNILENGDFNRGAEPWILDPEEYTSRNGDGPLGCFWAPNAIIMVPRLYKVNSDAAICTISSSGSIDTATDVISVIYRVVYFSNPPDNQGAYTFNVKISANSDMSSPLYNRTFNQDDYPVGSELLEEVNVNLPTPGWTGTLYVQAQATALTSTDYQYSNPQFRVDKIFIFANGEVELAEEAELTTPYTADDLEDVHYVQSPYEDKELVLTHPRHPPKKFYFSTGGGTYVFESISFTNTPSVWAVNNYPATCTSYQGRLVLAGSQTFKVASGDPIAAASETVWTTKVGNWAQFSTTLEVDPDDSVIFNTIYRSPIQWAYGQKSLLIGALEYEYVVKGDTIFSPGDVQIELHSTNGSTNVQPAAFGAGVFFASDGGSKVRMMRYNDDDGGWVAPDLTIMNPGICLPRIKRMVRLRNPHQMCMIVTERGEMAIFHAEQEIMGWSRYKLSGAQIVDVCVVQDEDGFDVPFFLVQRRVEGVLKTYIEAIPQFNNTSAWDYTQSTTVFNFQAPTDTLTGLDHLEGKVVQVYDRNRYLGPYTVTAGEVTLDDQAGGTTTVLEAKVGLAHNCTIKTLPPETQDPGAAIRYTRFGVRILASTIPIVNGERAASRKPVSVLNASQVFELLADVEVSKAGWDPYQIITIEETVPMRVEVLGIYGDLKSNSV